MNNKYWKDEKTGLYWELKTFGNMRTEYSIVEAKEYVDELNTNKYGDFDDWRLPTIEELASICPIEPYPYAGNHRAWKAWYEGVREKANDGIFIVQELASNVGKDGWYWSSTKKSDTEYYLLNFKEGNTNFHNFDQSFYVRCVRG